MKVNQYPRPWSWAQEARPRRLSEWACAPKTNGFYELGYMTEGRFEAKYCGRAAGVTLATRLRQHHVYSHNPKVRRYSNKLWYRCKSFKTFELAAYVEALHLAALEYAWNERNEWRQHWALED